MTDDALVNVDHMSLAHSLEVRGPLPPCGSIDPAVAPARPGMGFPIPAACWSGRDWRVLPTSLLFDRNTGRGPGAQP